MILELGGKKTGIHPEVFSIGFGPVLWSRVDEFGTKWQVAALPFGGYVKFLGDANASGGRDKAVYGALDDDQHGDEHGDAEQAPQGLKACQFVVEAGDHHEPDAVEEPGGEGR